MIENVKLKIVESHEEILNIIDEKVGTLVNFSCRAGYPIYPEKIFDISIDVDIFSRMFVESRMIWSEWLDNNWVPLLTDKGYIDKYIWMYPHDCAKDEIKKFMTQKGSCEVYNIRFHKTKIPYSFVVVGMEFFGCKVPVNWSPIDRRGLLINLLESLTARDINMIISKSANYVNYNIENFLDEMKVELSRRATLSIL